MAICPTHVEFSAPSLQVNVQTTFGGNTPPNNGTGLLILGPHSPLQSSPRWKDSAGPTINHNSQKFWANCYETETRTKTDPEFAARLCDVGAFVEVRKASARFKALLSNSGRRKGELNKQLIHLLKHTFCFLTPTSSLPQGLFAVHQSSLVSASMIVGRKGISFRSQKHMAAFKSKSKSKYPAAQGH